MCYDNSEHKSPTRIFLFYVVNQYFGSISRASSCMTSSHLFRLKKRRLRSLNTNCFTQGQGCKIRGPRNNMFYWKQLTLWNEAKVNFARVCPLMTLQVSPLRSHLPAAICKTLHCYKLQFLQACGWDGMFAKYRLAISCCGRLFASRLCYPAHS